MRSTQLLAFGILLAASACSGSSDPASDKAAETPAPSEDAAGPALSITPAYLAGEWCYEGYGTDEEFSKENVTYNFAADGTLKYQTNPSTPVDKDGSYEFTDGVLKIKPALSFISLKPETLDQDRMVFNAMGAKSIWSRGACKA